MGNNLYVDKSPMKIDQLLSCDSGVSPSKNLKDLQVSESSGIGIKPGFSLKINSIQSKSANNAENNNKQSERSKSLKNFIKVWRLSEQQIKNKSLPEVDAYNFLSKEKDLLSLSSSESYIILLIFQLGNQGGDAFDKLELPEEILEILDSTKNITNRGLEYAFATNLINDSILTLDSQNYKYVLFIWNGFKVSDSVKSLGLLKANELDIKLQTSDLIKLITNDDSQYVNYNKVFSDEEDEENSKPLANSNSQRHERIQLLRYINLSLTGKRKKQLHTYKNFKSVFLKGKNSQNTKPQSNKYSNYFALFQDPSGNQSSSSRKEEESKKSDEPSTLRKNEDEEEIDDIMDDINDPDQCFTKIKNENSETTADSGTNFKLSPFPGGKKPFAIVSKIIII